MKKDNNINKIIENILTIFAFVVFFGLIGFCIYSYPKQFKTEQDIKKSYVEKFYKNKDLTLDDIQNIKNENNEALNLYAYNKGIVTTAKVGNSNTNNITIEYQNNSNLKKKLTTDALNIMIVDVTNKGSSSVITLDKSIFLSNKTPINLVGRNIRVLEFSKRYGNENIIFILINDKQ